MGNTTPGDVHGLEFLACTVGFFEFIDLEHGSGMIYAGVPSFCVFRLEDGRVPTFWLLL